MVSRGSAFVITEAIPDGARFERSSAAPHLPKKANRSSETKNPRTFELERSRRGVEIG